MFSPVKLFFFIQQATQYSNLSYAESPRQQSNYCLGSIPIGSCLCLQGQAGCLEWIIEVLMWTSSVAVLPPRSSLGLLPVMDLIWGWFISRLSTAINVRRNDLRLLTSKAQTVLRSGMMKGDIWCYPVDTPVCWSLCNLSAHLYQCECVCVAGLFGFCPFLRLGGVRKWPFLV